MRKVDLSMKESQMYEIIKKPVDDGITVNGKKAKMQPDTIFRPFNVLFVNSSAS